VLLTVHTIALAGATLSAAATIWIRQGLRTSSFYAGFWINLAVGVVGLWGAVFLHTGVEALQVRALPFFILSGLLGTACGRLLRFVSIEKVGAAVAASVINLNPFIATALAILLLGERVTLPILVGTLVIVMGTVLLSLSGQQGGFRVSHLVYPCISAACFGAVAVVRKVGLQQAGPLFGSAVNMTTAFIAVTVCMLIAGQRTTLRCRGRSLLYFIAAGVAENAGVFLGIVALSYGEVSIVIPLTGTAPLFVLAMTYLFLQGVERLSWPIVTGSVLIVAGVALLTVSPP
jgi:uncharacterized membrane protein